MILALKIVVIKVTDGCCIKKKQQQRKKKNLDKIKKLKPA